MYPPRARHTALFAALDQAFFFGVIFALTYVAIFLSGWGAAPIASYAVLALMSLPLVVVSAVFAAQLSRREPPPVERRDRSALREIRPQEPARQMPGRAA